MHKVALFKKHNGTREIPGHEGKPAPTCILRKSTPIHPIQIHGLQESVFINLSIKGFQAAKNQGALRSGHHPAPPNVDAKVNI